MAPTPFARSSHDLDQSPRFYSSSTVVASPSANAETVICSITGIDGSLAVATGVWLSGAASFTVGTSGASVQLRIRTGTTAGAGTVIANTGALTGGVSAGNLLSQDIQNLDTGASGGAAPVVTSYCLTLTVGSGAAASTVSQTNLVAFVI